MYYKKIHLSEAFVKQHDIMLQAALLNITDPLLDELDWPQLGFGIGFMNSTYPVLVKVCSNLVVIMKILLSLNNIYIKMLQNIHDKK